MRNFNRPFISFLLAAALATPVLVTGCSARVSNGYVNDGHYNDNHWSSHETVYYSQWESSTHRDHVDYQKRSAEEQNEYWAWRHNNNH